jgi:heme exporter protein C
MKQSWLRYSSPATFYPLAGRLVPWLGWLAALLILAALYWGFFHTPDRLGGMNSQKEYYRIIFIHVASAWMSMWLYLVMVGWSAVGLVFNTRLSFMMANAVAPTGAIFTFIALWSGSFWGRPSWGTWWDWDPRLTSELILLFLYGGYMALHSAIDDTRRADRASALLAIVGAVCVPNILAAMLLMTFGFWSYSLATAFARVRSIILLRETDAAWVRDLQEVRP